MRRYLFIAGFTLIVIIIGIPEVLLKSCYKAVMCFVYGFKGFWYKIAYEWKYYMEKLNGL